MATAAPLVAFATLVWLLLPCSSLLFIWLHVPLEAASTFHNCAAAAPLKSTALGLHAPLENVVDNCVAAAPLESAALQEASPLEASYILVWLLLL